MLECPYFELGNCKYHISCRLEMLLSDEGLFDVIRKLAKQSWDFCIFRRNKITDMIVDVARWN